MSRLRSLGALSGVSAGLLLVGVAAPAYAGGSFQHCINQAVNHNGEPPTCTKVNGTWVASWPDDPTSLGSSGMPGAFVFFFVLALVVGIGLTVWKVTTAQKLARQSGMDPGLATQMTLLSDDGLDATYLAANLRQPSPAAAPTPPTSPAQPPAPTSAEARLTELRGLLDRGLITQAEYDERRTAIIDAV